MRGCQLPAQLSQLEYLFHALDHQLDLPADAIEVEDLLRGPVRLRQRGEHQQPAAQPQSVLAGPLLVFAGIAPCFGTRPFSGCWAQGSGDQPPSRVVALLIHPTHARPA